jgi:hypothetical protein
MGKRQYRRSLPGLFSARVLVAALIFGGIAAVLLVARFTVPIPGTRAVSDPREIFTTLGSAFTGPVGALLIAFLAGIAEPNGVPLASIFAHGLGCIWVSLAYQGFIYRSKIFKLLLLWALTMFLYYGVFLIPGYLIGLAVIYAQPVNFFEMYPLLASGAFPESIITIVLTSLFIIILPARYRRPWWK